MSKKNHGRKFYKKLAKRQAATIAMLRDMLQDRTHQDGILIHKGGLVFAGIHVQGDPADPDLQWTEHNQERVLGTMPRDVALGVAESTDPLVHAGILGSHTIDTNDRVGVN